MLWLAVKTLLRERARFLITLAGIGVAGVLALIEIAIYLGMMANATAVIRNTDGDLWVTSKNIQTFDFALPFPAERINQVRSFDDVAWADKVLLFWGFIKLPNGGREQVQIIGFNPDSGVGEPWTMVEGAPLDVKGGSYMIVDRTSEQRLGALATGTLWELTVMNREQSFKLSGLSQGIKSFTTAPVIFTSFNRLSAFFAEAGWGDQTSFIVAKLKNPAAAGAVADALRARLRDNEVFTKDQFIGRTVRYWTVQTGMGMAFFFTAALAMIIGGTIVGQTIYSSTLEHLREFGTLKAIGAKNHEIYQVVLAQAAISAVAGYAVASGVTLAMRAGIEKAGVPLQLNATLFVALFGVILAACLASGWFSVRKIRSVDPVTVFKA